MKDELCQNCKGKGYIIGWKNYQTCKCRHMKKQRIRIYKKYNEYEYFDISKGLTAFNDKCIQLQYIWVLSWGIKLC